MLYYGRPASYPCNSDQTPPYGINMNEISDKLLDAPAHLHAVGWWKNGTQSEVCAIEANSFEIITERTETENIDYQTCIFGKLKTSLLG